LKSVLTTNPQPPTTNLFKPLQPATSSPIMQTMHRNWPALAIGLIVGFYWARVIKLVLKTRRDTGRAANFVPPELLGRLLRVIWYPTVAAWICVPLIIAVARHLPELLLPLYTNPLATWPAVAVAFAALYGTLICWRRMGRSWRMGIDPNEKTQLIFTGAYAYVRHPIYALSSLLMLASLAAVPAPLMIVVAIIHLCFLQWEARREERYLVQLHGANYGSYLSHVGRFVPKALHAYAPGQ
jgi:protein-S-isoprenylcysteine O-methyltransferase Ste14